MKVRPYSAQYDRTLEIRAKGVKKGWITWPDLHPAIISFYFGNFIENSCLRDPEL